ncbi:MAG: ATP-binding protein [Clostridiales bacterium]|nr:ATP-binding protein [Clostridiales bacterium]
MFYGRKEELDFLEDRYKSDRGELIVLYGRRRIGKTELLREFSKDKSYVFYSCKETIDAEQLELFSKKLLKGNPLADYMKSFSAWEDAFAFIKDLQVKEKKLIIIDEFPYMVMNNSSIPSILQNLWDETLKNENLMIILCGSSMSFIEENILSEKNPLYGRATGIYKLNEIDVFTSALFFEHASNKEKVVRYSILGGVPHYLNQFDYKLSTEENVKKYILTKGSILYNEVEFLMKQELRETSVYYTIIEAVAMGNTKLNEIYMKTQIERAKISVYLKNLIKLNIIEKEYPVTEPIKKRTKAQGGLYKLKNNYFKFYFRFVYPNISELEESDVDGVYNYMVKPYLDEYASYVFEDVCVQYMRKLNKKQLLPFRYSKIGRWWKKQIEIDVLAMDNNKNGIFGECKWKNSKMKKNELEKLKEKSSAVEESFENKYYYLFSRSGFTDELIKIAQVDNSVKLITLDDIFE